MPEYPARTGKTSLTDDELLLFDFLFNCKAAFHHLRMENYGIHLNVLYTHNLQRRALEKTIGALIKSGLLFRDDFEHPFAQMENYPPDEWTYYGLTEAGGRLWEAEREPVWECYCIEYSWIDEESDKWRLTVRSPSLRIARAFLGVTREIGMYEVDIELLKTRTDNVEQPIPWKTFPKVYELTAPLLADSNSSYDWDHYERNRTWWGTITELATLRP